MTKSLLPLAPAQDEAEEEAGSSREGEAAAGGSGGGNVGFNLDESEDEAADDGDQAQASAIVVRKIDCAICVASSKEPWKAL